MGPMGDGQGRPLLPKPSVYTWAVLVLEFNRS